MVKEEFEKLMTPFTEFYGVELTKVQTQWWFKTFYRVPAETFSAALDWHIANEQYNGFPPPGRITAALREVEERRPQKKAFTTVQCSVWPYFPDGHDYRYFPSDSDEDKWIEIHDRIMCHDKHDDRIAEARIIAKELEGGK